MKMLPYCVMEFTCTAVQLTSTGTLWFILLSFILYLLDYIDPSLFYTAPYIIVTLHKLQLKQWYSCKRDLGHYSELCIIHSYHVNSCNDDSSSNVHFDIPSKKYGLGFFISLFLANFVSHCFFVASL